MFKWLWPKETVIEIFDSHVDEIRDGMAYVTMTSRFNDDILTGQYKAKELAKKGIYEQDSFLIKAVKVGKYTRLDIEKIP